MNWVPLWNDVLESRKVQSLAGDMFKAWINLLCLACKRDDNGLLPPTEDIAFALRVDEAKALELVEALAARGLVDRIDGAFFIHDWTEWQLPSYNSTKRVREHRERRKNQQRNNLEPSSNGQETGGNEHETTVKPEETLRNVSCNVSGTLPKHECNDLELEEKRKENTGTAHVSRNVPETLQGGPGAKVREGQDLADWNEALAELHGSKETQLIGATLEDYAGVPSVSQLEAWRFVHAAHVIQSPDNNKTWDFFMGVARKCSRAKFDGWHKAPSRSQPPAPLTFTRKGDRDR